jgi:tripartite-type tricarboxylate transporter receptor subunit TctC
MKRREFMAAGSAWATLQGLGTAHAQAAFPSKTIRVMVPFSAGGSPDLVARLMSQQLGKQLGQSVVVDNKLGANGIIAQEALANAPPDGHTLLVNTGSHAINPSIYKKLPFDTLTDLAPVSLLTVAPALTLVVSPNFAAKNIKDFLTLARKPNGQVSFGSPGNGNTLHLVGELLNHMAGTQMLHVPYKGAAPALNAVISGEVSACFLSTTAAVLAVRAGQVRPLAVTSAQRIASFPDTPTLAESGVPDFDYNGGWMGVFAPGKTPRPLIRLLSTEINKTLQEPEVRDKMLSWESPPVNYTPEQFASFIQAEMDKFARIIKLANIPQQ